MARETKQELIYIFDLILFLNHKWVLPLGSSTQDFRISARGSWFTLILRVILSWDGLLYWACSTISKAPLGVPRVSFTSSRGYISWDGPLYASRWFFARLLYNIPLTRIIRVPRGSLFDVLRPVYFPFYKEVSQFLYLQGVPKILIFQRGKFLSILRGRSYGPSYVPWAGFLPDPLHSELSILSLSRCCLWIALCPAHLLLVTKHLAFICCSRKTL